MTIYYNLYPDKRFSGRMITDTQYEQLSDEMKAFFTDVPYVNPKNGGFMYFDGTNWVEKSAPIDPTKSTIMNNAENITKQSVDLQQTHDVVMQQSMILNQLQKLTNQTLASVNNMKQIVMQQANQIEALTSKATVNSTSASVKPSTSSVSASTNTSTTNTTNDKEGN